MSDITPTTLLDVNTKIGQLMLPNGCCLYWQENEVGGRRYFSDEIGGGVMVWDTSLVDASTLLTAMTIEASLIMKEYRLGQTTSNIASDEKGDDVDARPADLRQEDTEPL